MVMEEGRGTGGGYADAAGTVCNRLRGALAKPVAPALERDDLTAAPDIVLADGCLAGVVLERRGSHQSSRASSGLGLD